MKPEDIWNQVKTILESDTTLSGYVKEVYEGMRSRIPNAPCIILEPIQNTEKDVSLPERIESIFRIMIFGIIRAYDQGKQIVGDTENKGILDMEQDIKKALGAYPDLNGTCIYFEFPDTRFDFSEYPIRRVDIELAVHYRQDFKTRS